MLKFMNNTKHVAYGTKKASFKVGQKLDTSGMIIESPKNVTWIQKSIDQHKKSNCHYDSNIVLNVFELDASYVVLNVQKFK